MKKQLVRAAATTVLGISLTTGFAAADINTTGPQSSNNTNTSLSSKEEVRNNNNVRVHSDGYQRANSGNAVVTNSTNAGSASTGVADNFRSVDVDARVSNTAASSSALSHSMTLPAAGTGNISNTGPNSSNNINYSAKLETKVTNDNDIKVHSYSSQTADSGDAIVSNNTNGGSASTGDAINTSTERYTFSISN